MCCHTAAYPVYPTSARLVLDRLEADLMLVVHPGEVHSMEVHPKEVHLTIVDLFGPDAPKYLTKVGGGPRAVVSIDGRTSFSLGGRKVQLERAEGDSYSPSDIGPIVANELKRR